MTTTTTGPLIYRRRRIGFDKINRRTHLYAGLFFIPWFLFYALSSIVFNHPKWFDSGPPKMNLLFDRAWTAEPAPTEGDPRPFVRRALKANDLDGQFFVRWEPDGKIVVDQVRFLFATRISYDPATRRLTAMRAGFSWRTLLTRVHTRGGFDTNGSLQILWAVIVDVIQVAMIVWLASGLYMWWTLRRFRAWGLLALASGFGVFAAFLLGL
jgi:hypothetical protein